MNVNNIRNRIISNVLILVMLMITIGTVFTDSVIATTTENKGQWEFSYTGSSQDFIVPSDGNYKVQLWGAEGGIPSDSLILGGKGAYVEGYLNLKKDEKIQINVGGHPGKSSKPGFNGGGKGAINPDNPVQFGGGGGGATDIRMNGTTLQDRVVVSAGGAGGGQMYFVSSSTNALRSNASRGGAGGKEQGQSSGINIDANTGIGENAIYSTKSNYVNGGGSQSVGGTPSYGSTDYSGLFGDGGKGAIVNHSEIRTSYGGGGGAGYYGGAGGYYSGLRTPMLGGGGSSFMGSLGGNRLWANGWEIQPKHKGGTQVGNEGHGHFKISKSNDAPVLSLTEYAVSDRIYNSNDTIKYSGTIKDVDDLGGRMTIYSEVTMSGTEIYKQEHGMYNHSKEEQYFSADVYLPEHRHTKRVTSIKFWAEDSEGLKSDVFATNFYTTSPKDIQISVNPETNSWVKGSYRVNLEVKSLNNIRSITTSSGKLNVISTSDRKNQDGYITVSENKPVTVRVSDTNNNIEEKTIYINNIQDLKVENLTDSSFDYKIDNWGDKHGLVEKETKWEIRSNNSEVNTHLGSLSRRAKDLKPNEKIEVRYLLFNELGLELATGWTNFESIYTLAQHPVNVNVNKVEKDRVLFDFNSSNENVNKPRYIFKAIEIPKENGSELSIQNSQIVNEGEEVLIRNLKAETTYTLESATINGNEKQSTFKRMKDEQGNELRFHTKGSLELDVNNIEDWNEATLKGSIKYNNETPLAVYIHIGAERIKISDDILKDRNSDMSFNIDIKKGSKMITARETSKQGDATKTYEVTTNQGDGQYDVYIETVVNKFSEEHQVGWFGLDSRGPESKSKAMFKRVTKSQGILTLDKDNIRDLSTPNHQITIDYGQGRMPIFSNKLITYEGKMSINLYDKLNNMSILDWVLDTDSSYEEGEDNNVIDPPEERPTVEIDDSTVEIEVPSGGTHMQTSLDGVTWSMWEERRNTVKVALPTGDGMKSVFVRTGVETYKETPVYNVETFRIEMVKQKGGAISVLNNTRVYKYIMDLTAPKLSVRTMDNSLIAINGKIIFLVDIVDNLDTKPKVTVEIFERDGGGLLTGIPIRSVSGKVEKTSLEIKFGYKETNNYNVGFQESRDSKGKLQPYTLKATAEDASGNRTVEYINFYAKDKK